MPHPDTRDTIFVEDAAVLQHHTLDAGQYLLRLAAGATAERAMPGSFVHLRCHEDLPMRRPMSVMRADPRAGWIDILYKAHGQGTDKLAGARVGDCINLLGPIGIAVYAAVLSLPAWLLYAVLRWRAAKR